ncbi:hypothetical protein HPB51_012778 [Rhipicephalus microplus]|uniref:CCHC-type domain-containing protein n=1 Tax=Rhipicephalus microplus TaxID=6941 RepID=A0A9J6E9U3_RHIMP|nr:hypothetical protein HPB51_012778 [Rhipicephalus microplus]
MLRSIAPCVILLHSTQITGENRRDRTRLHRAPEFSDVSVGRRAIAQDFLYEWFLQIIPVPRIQLSDRYWSQFSSKLFIFSRHAGKIRHWTPKPSDATPNAAVAAAGTLADMEIEVDGVEISLEEWSDDSWTPPQGFRAQAKRHQALKQQAQMNDAQVSKAPKTPPTPRPPPELKRHPLPRLPSHTYHIVGRPKTPIDLTRTSPGDLQRALLKAASLCDLDPAKRDQLRIHPRNNTFTVSVATTDRAIAYQRITSILLGEDRQIELHMYAPPPDDAIRGISFYAHTFPTDDETLKDLQDSNPDYQIVGGRRMGKTKNLLITLLGDHLPRWLLHRGGLIRVYPFHPKVDACFNCRKTGHRSDVCPQPRRRRCPRCGEDHEPPPQGTPPTCQARCIVCQGGHMTNSSRCEYRFAKKSEPLNAAQAGKTLQTESPATQQTSNDDSPPALDERNYPSFGTSQTPTKRDSRSKSRSRQGQAASHSRSKSRTRSSSRIPHADISKAPPSNPSVAWAPSAASPLPSSPPQPSKPCASTHDPLVKELTQTINALKSQMATQQAQIEVLLAQNRSLESKLAKASQSVHNSTQQPQPPAAAKRKATTSTETLQSEEDMTARIIEMVNASVAEALRTTVQTTVVNAVRAAVTEAFATVDSRLTNIETRFSNMEATVNNTVAGLEALRTATDTSFAVIKQSMARAPAITRNRVTSHSSTQHSEPTTASTVTNPHRKQRCRDTSPDLTYCKNIAQARWENTCQLAGSDHYIIAIQVQTSAGKRVHNALAQITEWPKFRDIRESEAPERITNLKEWTASLNDHVRRTTRESKAAEETPATDSRLLHMWDAHASLLRRWQKQRYNKKLRRRIQALSEEIERHSTYLARQQWGQLCSGLNGQLGNKKTWHLLRHLLDPDDSKTAARHRLKRLVHQHPGSDEDLLIELADKYINQAHQPATPLPPYEGKPNPTLDADITEAEVYAAILKLRTTSAPGPDGVSNKTIRNLDASARNCQGSLAVAFPTEARMLCCSYSASATPDIRRSACVGLSAAAAIGEVALLGEVEFKQCAARQSLCNALDELDNKTISKERVLRYRQDFMSQKKAVKALLRFFRSTGLSKRL